MRLGSKRIGSRAFVSLRRRAAAPPSPANGIPLPSLLGKLAEQGANSVGAGGGIRAWRREECEGGFVLQRPLVHWKLLGEGRGGRGLLARNPINKQHPRPVSVASAYVQ